LNADPVRLSWSIWKQRQHAGAFQRHGESALVPGAGPGFATRLDLAALRDVAAEPSQVLVVDLLHAVHAELADLAAVIAAVVAAGTLPAGGATFARSTFA